MIVTNFFFFNYYSVVFINGLSYAWVISIEGREKRVEKNNFSDGDETGERKQNEKLSMILITPVL